MTEATEEVFVEKLTNALQDGIKTEYKTRRSVLSFSEYLEEVTKNPKRHLRNSGQYFSDVIDFFGSYKVSLPYGEFTRYALFDTAFDKGEGQVMGQEGVQENIVRLIKTFVKSGRIDRLIMLHGPNGSAKTSLVQALSRAAEIYSHSEDGAVYKFNWIFPTKEAGGKSLGFGDSASKQENSHAFLENEDIASTLPCELKDHPLLLLNKTFRTLLFKHLEESHQVSKDNNIPFMLLGGDLSAKNKKIYDSLLSYYQGDVLEVLKHVQVERFYFSRRYRRGIASVEPQMSVDAHVRQIMLDQSLANLPATLQHLNLFATGGALSEGNRGLIEFSDLLKRPIESWKYLLIATEQAHVNMESLLMFLDVLMIATSNELHLASFREYPDWQSFKGRFELVRVPYLLRYSDELKIYENQIPKNLVNKHIAPHALEIASKWAVLTRLEAPKGAQYSLESRDLVLSLTPMEKMELYDSGIVPDRITQKDAKILRKLIPKIFNETTSDLDYEGRYGASPREVRMLLLNAAQNSEFDHLSPIAVLGELRSIVLEKSSYDFLRRESSRGFRDAVKFVDDVEKFYIAKLDEEIRSAMGLVKPDSHFKLFKQYVQHVSAWTKKEKIYDDIQGVNKDPDANLMCEIEKILLARSENLEDFRRSLISQIGAFRLENVDQQVDYTLLFGNYLRRIKDNYYEKQKGIVDKIIKSYLTHYDSASNKEIISDKKIIKQIETLKHNLEALGYNESSAKHALAYLLNAKR